MITQSIAKDCPHVRKASGVIHLQPEIVAGLAGAASDKDEWAIVLQGERSEDAYEITVTGWRLPEQERTGGHVDLSKDVLQTPFSNPPGNDVCVVHLHPGYGYAHFSTLDKDKLNTRYPASIVISQSKTSLLGFEYEAVGKVQLPCGGRGEITFHVQPMTGPEMAKVNRVVHNEADLGDCVRAENVAQSPWQVQWRGACGLVEPKVHTKVAAFGVSNEILDVVSKLSRERERKQLKGFQGSHGASDFRGYTTERKLAVGWECPKDKTPLYWSTQKDGRMYCDKCNGYFTEPASSETKDERKGETIDTEGMEWCESCEAFVVDNAWACSVCEAEYCSNCSTYHDGSCLGRTVDQVGMVLA